MSSQKRRRQEIQNDNSLKEAVSALKDIRQNVLTNEFTVFGSQVGLQLNKLSLQTALKIQQKIQTILTEARLQELHATRFSPADMSTSSSRFTPISIIVPNSSSPENSIFSP